MSDTEDLQKTLTEAQAEVSQQLDIAQTLKKDPEAALKEREDAVHEALLKAKSLYQKKEYGRAFAEWEKVCAFLGERDEFRSKIRALKESHENLLKVNQELLEIKEVIRQRSSPGPSEAKFVEEAHDSVTAEVKKVYSHLGQQLRTERQPKGLSFWWPVVLSLGILALGFAGLAGYFSSMEKRLAARSVLAPAASDPLDGTYLEAQRNAAQKQIEALKREHEKQIEALNRKHAEASKGDRERIIQLETGLREAESANLELERQAKALIEDNISKDKTIASLS